LRGRGRVPRRQGGLWEGLTRDGRDGLGGRAKQAPPTCLPRDGSRGLWRPTGPPSAAKNSVRPEIRRVQSPKGRQGRHVPSPREVLSPPPRRAMRSSDPHALILKACASQGKYFSFGRMFVINPVTRSPHLAHVFAKRPGTSSGGSVSIRAAHNFESLAWDGGAVGSPLEEHGQGQTGRGDRGQG
jgi:hypothetical protein